jgi:XTP/dITP diphosphohydrolase
MSSTTIEAVLVSGNAHKLSELRAILPDWRIESLPLAEPPEETGSTYLENARIKARFGRERSPEAPWVLGEDSGIECRALGGAPGLHSARWAAGRDQADALLERLAGESDREARMVSELVALSPDGVEFRGAGALEGEIARERRGHEGFGYDPIFIPRGHDRTVAEIGEVWKRRNSHRAQAALALVAALEAAAGR